MTPDLAEKLATVRKGVSFEQCLYTCVNDKEFVASFDALMGTNLSLKGSPLDLLIDVESGRLDSDIEKFIDTCWDTVFSRF